MPGEWYEVENVAEIPSPALLVYPDRVEFNIRKMVELAGGNPARLRPHFPARPRRGRKAVPRRKLSFRLPARP